MLYCAFSFRFKAEIHSFVLIVIPHLKIEQCAHWQSHTTPLVLLTWSVAEYEDQGVGETVRCKRGLCWPQSASLSQDFSAEEKQTSFNEQMSNSRPPVRPYLPNHFITVALTGQSPDLKLPEDLQPLTYRWSPSNKQFVADFQGFTATMFQKLPCLLFRVAAGIVSCQCHSPENKF